MYIYIYFVFNGDDFTTCFQEETWATNANAFVAQEDDETSSYSVRIAGFDLLGASLHRSLMS